MMEFFLQYFQSFVHWIICWCSVDDLTLAEVSMTRTQLALDQSSWMLFAGSLHWKNMMLMKSILLASKMKYPKVIHSHRLLSSMRATVKPVTKRKFIPARSALILVRLKINLVLWSSANLRLFHYRVQVQSKESRKFSKNNLMPLAWEWVLNRKAAMAWRIILIIQTK